MTVVFGVHQWKLHLWDQCVSMRASANIGGKMMALTLGEAEKLAEKHVWNIFQSDANSV